MYSKKEEEVRRFSFLLDILCCVAVLCGEEGDVAEEPPLYCYIQVHDSPTIIGSWQSDDYWFMTVRRLMVHDSLTMIRVWQSDDEWCMTVRRWLAWMQRTRVTVYWRTPYVVRERRVEPVECMLVWRNDVIGLSATKVLELTPFPLNISVCLTVVTLNVNVRYIIIYDYMTVWLLYAWRACDDLSTVRHVVWSYDLLS